ncbi:rhodanese-like domain-containing protein [Flavobacteriaceae bacterium]|nr:rhodanese-like domain-containing protein [Flavobacteriaceae bacterium]MDC1492486.1 rhodanese-like domain-containing protein [Flavobacteriaceae bacterium]
MLKKYIIICILTTFFSCDSAQIINKISATDFLILNDKEDIQLIDVRRFEEYNNGYIEGAVNIDFYKSTFIDSINMLDKSKTTVVYCKSGNRSSKSALMMKSLGFETIYDLNEGMNGWLGNRYVVIDSLN